ncbi:hypothetical protein CB0940_09198 [Cercospora beticola]|uniref:Uncharacterized protein n=1 Tax=Cercospora beticola TaxID=122368 RepID=A0A2G5HGT7_CERBT|nr:hypothetical protein CB0940_09198 [Cercospora beticola]PIA91806.1 hypothetical protein CB0940_09198 [Cercospora beticola]WPB06507.1 hypothetical protein RHO25_011164 [Cercospora beticola]
MNCCFSSLPNCQQFEDIKNVNPVIGFGPPTPYKGLAYTAFGLGAPVAGAITIQASSKPNAIFAPYLLTDPLAKPEISSSYSGSQVVSFDMKSVASGCYAATQNGALAPAISCTIRYTGTKATTGEEVTFDAIFLVKKLNAAGVSLGPEPVQTQVFPARFSGLKSLKPRILTAALPAVGGLTAQMALDDITYTANVRK